MVILHRGFGGQNLGVKFGKFKKADLHHGLRGFWGDLLALDGIIGKQATAFIKANNDITKRIKVFWASIVSKEKCFPNCTILFSTMEFSAQKYCIMNHNATIEVQKSSYCSFFRCWTIISKLLCSIA